MFVWRRKGKRSILEKLRGEGLIKEVVWKEKKFVFVDKFLHYLYLMSLLRDQKKYRRIVLRSSNLKNYYSGKGLSAPPDFMLSVVEDFSTAPKSRMKKRVLKEVIVALRSRELKTFLWKARNRAVVYSTLYTIALRIWEKSEQRGVLSRIISWKKRKRENSRRGGGAEVFRLDGFSPPLYRLQLDQ